MANKYYCNTPNGRYIYNTKSAGLIKLILNDLTGCVKRWVQGYVSDRYFQETSRKAPNLINLTKFMFKTIGQLL